MDPEVNRPSSPDGLASATAERETEYLDLDHDGLPDAVRRHTAVVYHLDGDAAEVVDELATGIGDDGVPTVAAVTDAVALDIDADGTVDRIEVSASLALNGEAPANGGRRAG
jgi:hypothetical protein